MLIHYDILLHLIYNIIYNNIGTPYYSLLQTFRRGIIAYVENKINLTQYYKTERV